VNLPGHTTRIENSAGAGQPDVNCCYQGSEAWVELKMAKGNYWHFRRSQLAWAAQRCSQGGRALVLGRAGDTLYLFPMQVLVDLHDVFEPAGTELRIKIAAIKTAKKFPKPFNWCEIIRAIYFENESYWQ
jgi:hypothetical protein